MRVDQWVPALHRGDAIGDSARLMRDALRRRGHAADVYALEIDDDLRGDGRPWSEWRTGGAGDVLLLHYALPSPLSAAWGQVRCRRVLLYHNVTPPEFFRGFDPELERICRLGRDELGGLRAHADLALGDSEFNRAELEAAGFERTGVLPILLDFERYLEPAVAGETPCWVDPQGRGRRPAAGNRVLRRLLDDGLTNLLFVGRVAPNKRHEDLLCLAAAWKRALGPTVRLLLVGKLPRRRHYFDALQARAYEHGFTPQEVLFTGHVEHDDLLACYRAARVFVSLSAHEGFGVPLVEAMLMDVPILARRAAAVADTLGPAGVQLDPAPLDGPRLAQALEAAALLAGDEALRTGVLAGQRRRLQAFAPQAVEAQLWAHLESLTGRA